jgi:hypothetical protein
MKIDSAAVIVRPRDLPPGECFYYKGQLHMVINPGAYEEDLKEQARYWPCLAVNLITNRLVGLCGEREEIAATAKIVIEA